MFKKCSWCTAYAGLIVLRIGVGAIFIFSGWMKAADMTMTINGFSDMGFNTFWAYLVTICELLGGVGVLLGLYTRLSAIPLVIIMMVASYILRGNTQMLMTPVILLFSTAALAIAGSGKYALIKNMCDCGSCDNCADNKTSLDK